MWVVTDELCENFLQQMPHRKGFSPEWVLACAVKFAAWLKLLLHMRHLPVKTTTYQSQSFSRNQHQVGLTWTAVHQNEYEGAFWACSAWRTFYRRFDTSWAFRWRLALTCCLEMHQMMGCHCCPRRTRHIRCNIQSLLIVVSLDYLQNTTMFNVKTSLLIT